MLIGQPIPVILDTDIGSDIDDVWALALALRSPELDIRLITTAHADTSYRARIVAKLLQAAGRTDIPIGIGPATSDWVGAQEPWVRGYDLAGYPGIIHVDGVGAMLETIMNSPQPVTVIAIGPMTNVAEALRREPRIVNHARLVAMLGSIRRGYFDGMPPVAEYNVAVDAAACRACFQAGWDVTITPLDTCGRVQLSGEKYLRVHGYPSALLDALRENYRIWDEIYTGEKFGGRFGQRSTILFDAVAIYLAFDQSLVEMEDMSLIVTDEGRTVPEAMGKPIHCATAWRDLAAFEDLMVNRLCGEDEV